MRYVLWWAWPQRDLTSEGFPLVVRVRATDDSEARKIAAAYFAYAFPWLRHASSDEAEVFAPMRLYASDLCACRGDPPTTGTVRLGLQQCARCGMLRAGATDVIIRPPAPSWREDGEPDGRVTPSVERGARQSRFHGRPNIALREYLAGLEGA